MTSRIQALIMTPVRVVVAVRRVGPMSIMSRKRRTIVDLVTVLIEVGRVLVLILVLVMLLLLPMTSLVELMRCFVCWKA